jgi:hypothetical protein
MAMVIVMVEN